VKLRSQLHTHGWYKTVFCNLLNNLFCVLFVWWWFRVKTKHFALKHSKHKRLLWLTVVILLCIFITTGRPTQKSDVSSFYSRIQCPSAFTTCSTRLAKCQYRYLTERTVIHLWCLIFPRSVIKFSAFYGTHRFINVLTKSPTLPHTKAGQSSIYEPNLKA
jgi:hypothetical protein